MRKKLRNMGMSITELADMMDISRPTLYKFIDLYDEGEREKIDPNALKVLDHVKRNPRMGKKDLLYFVLLIQGGKGNMGIRHGVPATVTVTFVERPARKLIFLRSKGAVDYLSYCEEMGCDWEGVLNNIPERFDDAAIVDLPRKMIVPGTSGTASGVEVPIDHSGDIPEGYDIAELPPCTMLYFRGSQYDNEEDFSDAIQIVFDALNAYEPELFGWKFDPEAAPSFNYGASGEKGARIAVAVSKI